MKRTADSNTRLTNPTPLVDRILGVVSRQNVFLLLAIVCCIVAAIGALVVSDLQATNAATQESYTRSVHGLQRIGEMQYDAQETRRATLYALTTNDSNLQVEYADQSRDADMRVSDAISDYARLADLQAERILAARLNRDWATYVSVRNEVIASILEGSTREAVGLDLSVGVPAFERVRQDLREVKELYEQDAAVRQAALIASSRRSISRLTGILSFTFLLSGAAVWVIQRSHLLGTIQLARLQMEFVASVSHELRTPLAVLVSAADNLADGLVEGKPAVQKYGAIMRHQSRNIGSLVDQILLFASTEDGKKHYTLEPLEVAPLIESIITSTKELTKQAGVSLDVQIDHGLPRIMGNSTGVSQCMQNLIGNAVKYGGVDRQVIVRASAAPNGEVLVSVADHGIGIDTSELPYIFNPFYRSPRVRAAQIHGTGLGLSLARRIAEAMGGALSVVSERSIGTTFTLHLQIAKGEDTVRGEVTTITGPVAVP